MKKTLYISDLDGTLLNREGVLSRFTADTVRRFIAEGGLFTIATGRSLQSCDDLIWLLGLQLPAILVNGATIYDSVNKSFLEIKSLPVTALGTLLDILDTHEICGFLYVMRDHETSIYYRRFYKPEEQVFFAQRIERYKGRIYQNPHPEQLDHASAPYLLVAHGSPQQLQQVQKQLLPIKGVVSEIYENTYDGSFFMDVFSDAASKANGMMHLRELLEIDELVAFGDNFNDIPMLLAADRSYVPHNGFKAARQIATEVLVSADQDAVAHFLAREMGWES